jgi:hypothetical protein
LYLPVQRPNVSKEDLRDLRRELRELSYHPEKYLAATAIPGREPAVRAYLEEKQSWIRTPVCNANAYERWNAFRRINDQLQPWVASRRQQLLDLQAETQRALRHDKVLGSREYGFCLYSESYLRDFLGRLL